MGKPKGTLAGFLAVMLTLNLCGAMWALLWPLLTGKATTPSDLAVFVIGNLTGAVLGTIVGYFFGTSASSKAKDDLIAVTMKPPEAKPPEG